MLAFDNKFLCFYFRTRTVAAGTKLGRVEILSKEKQEKTKKNKINYFVFIIIIDPSVNADMQISKREVGNLDFLESFRIRYSVRSACKLRARRTEYKSVFFSYDINC
jgi:hypothetical protein